MGGVIGKPVFAMLALVGVVGLVMPASFVEAAGHLTQTVDDVLFLHGVCPAVAIRVRKGTGPVSTGRSSTTLSVGKGVPNTKRFIINRVLLSVRSCFWKRGTPGGGSEDRPGGAQC